MTSIVASDIDGTLLRSDRTVGDRTRTAVSAIEEAGTRFVLVTGRPPRWLAPVRDQLARNGARRLAICANGALVVDLDTGEVVQVDAFTPDDAREVFAAIRAMDANLSLGVEWPDGFAHDDTYPRGIRQSEELEGVVGVDDDEGFLVRPVAKVLARTHDHDPADLADAVTAATDGLATVTWSSTGLLEISASGVTKASALKRLADAHGVEATDVVAFGDMPNDLAMLGWAGHGVAVANADPLVLDAADEVTASNDDDGVAVVLERIVSNAS